MTDAAGQRELVTRVKAILTSPKTEWPVIAAEPATMADIYTKYIFILAAIPVVATFISSSILGIYFFRMPVLMGLERAVATYVMYLVSVFITALIADALAPNFGGTRNQVQALKAIAYSFTASWVVSVAIILPLIGWLIALAGGIYSLYLLYLGLPVTMKSPEDRALPYTAAVVVCSIVAWIVLGIIMRIVVGGPGLMGYGIMGRGMTGWGAI